MNERGQLTTVRGRARPSMLHNSRQRVVNYAHTVRFGRNRTHRQALDGMPVHRPIREHDVFRVFPCQEGSSSEPLHLTFPCSADGMGTSAAALLILTTPFNSSFDWWSAQPAGPSEGGAPDRPPLPAHGTGQTARCSLCPPRLQRGGEHHESHRRHRGHPRTPTFGLRHRRGRWIIGSGGRASRAEGGPLFPDPGGGAPLLPGAPHLGLTRHRGIQPRRGDGGLMR